MRKVEMIMTLALMAVLFSVTPLLEKASAEGFAHPRTGKTIRILSLNLYGRKKRDCASRFAEIAKRIREANPPYDVVSLNEDWNIPIDTYFTCGASQLWKHLEKDPRFADQAGLRRSLRHYPATVEFGQAAGGNSLLTPHAIIDAHEDRYVNSRDVPLSGYLMTRIELEPGFSFDVWTTHLEAASDGCDDDCRHEQIADLASAVEGFSGTGRNAVLIMGDFNVGGPVNALEKKRHDKSPRQIKYSGNPGYDILMTELKNPRDLWLELHAEPAKDSSPFTVDCTLNNTIKTPCDYRERIDYVFVPTHRAYGQSGYQVIAKKIETVRWKTASGLDVSDHFGLDATLEIRPRTSPSKQR